MLGVYGKRATRETVSLLRSTGACGVLLLARNIESPAQTRALTEELVCRLGRPLLFAVDHEGGWVLRFKSGLTAFPGNAALGLARKPALAYAVGRQMARELYPLGIRVNLAPVLDVLAGRYNPGIGIRSFGSDAALAARMGASMIRGLQDNGVSACAKHFPGKGAATKDAHVELPTIRMSRGEFSRTHLLPFKAAISAGVDCVMTSHVRFPALDLSPATFSRKITRGLLRERLGFDGAVLADDLCMGAVTNSEAVASAAVKAFEAGHDILLVAHQAQIQREAVDCLRRRAENGGLDKQELEDSRRRIERLLAPRERPGKASEAEGLALSREIAARAVTRVQRGGLSLPLSPNAQPLLLLFPDFAEVRERFTFENGPRGPERALREALKSWGRLRLRRTPVEAARLGNLAAEVRRAPRILFFCFEAMRFAGQKAVLGLLNDEASERTVVCLIRNSWDKELLSPKMTALDVHGYRLAQLNEAVKTALGSTGGSR